MINAICKLTQFVENKLFKNVLNTFQDLIELVFNILYNTFI